MSTEPNVHTDDDIDPAMAEVLTALATVIAKDMPEGFGFALMMFHMESNSTWYISSAQRKSIIKVMRQFIKRYDTQ